MKRLIVGLVLVAALVATGCGSSSSATKQQAPPPGPAKDNKKPAETPGPM